MRILFVSPRQCWPMVSGSKLRDYYLARALGRCASLTYVFFAEPGLSVPASTDLPFCAEIVPVPKPPRYTPARIVRGMLGRWPLPVVNYTSADMKAALSRLMASRRFDLVHLDSTHLAAYSESLRQSGIPIVVSWHNIESEGMRRYARNTASPLRRAAASVTARRMEGLEAMLLGAMFGNVVCSERERQQLLPMTPPRARIAVIENGVDVAYFGQAQAAGGQRHRILFVGSMNYHANIDAIVPFARRVWPRIREKFPQWRLTIAGASPAPPVLDLRREPGVEVTGTVGDLGPYYREAFAVVVPLRTGMGTRLKILEAMAAGVPVVSSSIGAEGLAVTPGKDIFIADTGEEWLPALASLTDTTVWRGLAECAGALVRSRYDWPILGERLVQTYRQWLNK